jgi:hypothetical protein
MQLNRPLATITPTLDGDVLALLAQHEVTFTAGQLHRILDRYSEEGIRKVLRVLTSSIVSIWPPARSSSWLALLRRYSRRSKSISRTGT